MRKAPTLPQHPQLADIPDALLVRSAEYLSNTSCVSHPSDISTNIARATRESWESIDLKDIQDICGRSLTDDDVRWILLAIDAVNCVKSISMTNCIGITGAGLEPLRGSIGLEKIDLSLVGDYENPTINPEPPISVSTVVPILESIINTEGNSLVHVQLPKKWRLERREALARFLERFDRKLNDRRFVCSNPSCGEVCEGVNGHNLFNWQAGGLREIYFGTNNMTCYQCMKNFCLSCYEDWGICTFCDKFYCNDCNRVSYCQGVGCLSPTSNQCTSCEECDVVKIW